MKNKTNIINFNERLKQRLVKGYATDYDTLSEKYILMIVDELESRGYNIRGNEDMLDEFMMLKDTLNLVAMNVSNRISETDKIVLQNIIALYNQKDDYNDSM